MTEDVFPYSTTPTLELAWRTSTGLVTAVAGGSRVYGISPQRRILAVDASDGRVLWQTEGTYLQGYLTSDGSRLLAYLEGRGLAYIDDLGDAASERVAISFDASFGVQLCSPVIDGRNVYYAVNQGLYAVSQDRGLLFGSILDGPVPHRVVLLGPGELIAINGQGVPTRYRATESGFQTVWMGSAHGMPAIPMLHPSTNAGSVLIVGLGAHTVAYHLGTGSIAWRMPSMPAKSLATTGGQAYIGGQAGALWAIRPEDGSLIWHRQYLFDEAITEVPETALAQDFVYYGSKLRGNPDGGLLLAVRAGDGAFQWLSRAVTGSWAGGIPLVVGSDLYTFGASHLGKYRQLSAPPRITAGNMQVIPLALRGPSSQFGDGSVRLQLPSSARVGLAVYRERAGLAVPIADRVNLPAGTHDFRWSPGGVGGFSEDPQFGYMVLEVEEAGGAHYTQAVLLPVNTFPDILRHWARRPIEIMVYNRFVSGYPDALFRPDNLVTRAESSTIIAKTLGLEGPSAGFRTSFTDIDGHWARSYIMALEERGIVTGFAEPGGTFTFRPELSMTRGQEARILIRAYAIAAAPAEFVSKFTDTAGHWAKQDIEALEFAGYVNGFLEPDGTYTYRPEQNLNRAELCTVVVRIRGLTAPTSDFS